MLGLLVSSGCGPPGSDSLRFADLWLTADQQGRRLFERGEYDEATRRFVDPMWKGVAAYSSGEFERAAESFARLTTAEASFNLGNAYAMVGRYQEAVTAYEAAIAERPGWAEAIENRETVLALIPVEPDLPEEEQTSGDPSFDPDEIQFDEKGKKGKPGEVQVEQLTDQQLAEMWLRRLETSPADFLRQRFALEAAADSENRE
jgi:Ca-activated chloride channel family protein